MRNEIRKDYLLDKWVIIAVERAKRPTDFKTEVQEINKAVNCPFCAGNENMTPPARMLYIPVDDKKIIIDRDRNSEKRRSDWIIRVVPNLFPALQPSEKAEVFSNYVSKISGIGDHEVIIESPDHHEQIQVMSDDQVKLVFRAYRDRFRDLTSYDFVKFVSIFRNYGKKAGASLSHPHSQIIATPIVPVSFFQEIKRLNFDGKRCKYDEIIEHERKSERFILERENVIAFSPFASTTPFEVWIFVKRHVHNILELSDEERDDLAIATRDILSAISKILNDPPYNYAIWQTVNEKEYHMHIRIFPRLTIYAGFEYNTNIAINPVPPEHAAKYIRETLYEICKITNGN
ncbi:MAG: DUF4931 domain-containing protein [Candidatus Asgardarchaeum sp.]